MKRLISYLKQNRAQTILAPLFKMLEAVFELLIPLLVARMIDVGVASADRTYILRTGLWMVLLGLIGFASAVTAQYFSANVATRCGTSMRSDLFSHILRFSYEQIDAAGTSALITRMTSDINQVQTGVNMFLRLFLRSPFIVFGAVIMAFVVDRRGAFPFAVAVPVLAVVVFLIIFLTLPLYRAIQNRLDLVLKAARENLRGVRVVRAFRREAEEIADFSAENAQLAAQQIFAGRISALLNPLTFSIVNLGIVAILMRGGRLVDAGALTQGAVIALINYMSQILVELIKLANLIITLSRAAASLRRIDEIFAVEAGGSVPAEDTGISVPADETTLSPPADTHDPLDQPLALDVRNLTYYYPETEVPALSEINFSVGAGETIGIIGGTGAGKSTLANLIARFFRPASGEIALGGIPLPSVRADLLRREVHVVPQTSALLSGDLRSNLIWGDEDASDDAILAALGTAQAADFVAEKEGGIRAKVASGGRNFSGGQRQRLAIARALIGDPKLLILDDASSALDHATEARLRAALGKAGTATTLLISQRVGSVRSADRILVLDGGKQCGFGTHRELLVSCEAYREICRSQMEEAEFEEEVRRANA